MSESNSEDLPRRQVIASLQEMLLRAALLGEALPGGRGPTRLADLHFILRHPHVCLSEDNLAGKPSAEGLPKPLRVMSRDELKKEAAAQGDLAYLQFRPAEPVEGGVRLTLEGKLATGDGRQTAGLSSVQVKFRKVGDGWETFGDPVAMAS